MTTEQNIFSSLRLTNVDPSELAFLLLEHFGDAEQVSHDAIFYPSSESHYSLKLVYDNGVLRQVLCGPGLSDTDLRAIQERVRNELVEDGGSVVTDTILFSVPKEVRGWWRYRDMLQILPTPARAPQPSFALGHHPFRLQFTMPRSKSDSLTTFRRLYYATRWELILNSLLNTYVTGLSRTASHHWVVMPPRGRGTQWRYMYLQETYGYHGMKATLQRFSRTNNSSLLPRIDQQQYYGERHPISAIHCTFPAT